MESVLHGVIDQALTGRSDRPDAICVGIAGADRCDAVVQAAASTCA
jgi:hypothetical protein